MISSISCHQDAKSKSHAKVPHSKKHDYACLITPKLGVLALLLKTKVALGKIEGLFSMLLFLEIRLRMKLMDNLLSSSFCLVGTFTMLMLL